MELEGKTVLITGSTDGVGRVVARRLAASGARVLVHGRDLERGRGLVAEIHAAGRQADFLQADLASLAEVRRLAAAVESSEERLDVLINNAGIGSGGAAGQRATSHDGFELRFAVNYLAGFLLTHLLLPKILASAPARIVNVASLGQAPLDFEDVMITRGYTGSRAYSQSKLAQIMFTIDLAEALAGKGVTVNSLHPATYMNTTMVRQSGTTPISSVDDGADAILNLVRSPSLEGRGGLFFDRRREVRANAQAYDTAARARLRGLSRRLVGLDAEAQG
ncbi:NAD(P)-dependent dehydrogenase, short-chain alcohol dehydrogenase family [Rhizobiales bacterium GAS191]|nr:NAD(P)-dependent dehydrogenase, short-chain alcohol dehydrogenase family [Rhizobiales bacterium GAS113]SEB88070.1 NAD(P)-dependent dehydrogenase, short-chain alcohol dehydrogenase family [Rhizobiales bacterium GAS191]